MRIPPPPFSHPAAASGALVTTPLVDGLLSIDTYGNLRNLKGLRQACPFRWPGQYEDPETGLYYNRFRYYDVGSELYASQDPIGLAGGLSVLGYVADPLILSDPIGLTACGTE